MKKEITIKGKKYKMKQTVIIEDYVYIMLP